MLSRAGRWPSRIPFTLVFACSGLLIVTGGILPVDHWQDGGLLSRLLAGLYGLLAIPAYLLMLVWVVFLSAEMGSYSVAFSLLTCVAADAGLAALRRYADWTYGRRGQEAR